MRFRGKSLLVVALAASLVTPNAFAAATVKAGATCTKSGSTIKSGSTTFVCTKSGKKLIWVRKAVIPVALPTTTATSTTPSIVFRMNGPQTVEGHLAMESVFHRLEKISADLYARSLNVREPHVQIFSDEPANPLIEPTRISALRTVQMMRALWPEYPDIEIYLYRNVSWLEEGPLKTLCPQVIRNQKMYHWANAGCFKYWVGSYTEYEDAEKKPWNPKFYTAKSLLMATGSHEAVHLIQLGNFNGNHYSFPAWYREGSATVGAELVMTSIPEFSNGVIGVVDEWELNSWSKQRCQPALELWKREIAPDGHDLTKACENSVGRKMMEYLVARDGNFDQIVKVYQAVPAMTFEAAFEKYHGQKLSDFLVEAEAWLEKLGWEKARHY